MAQDIIIIGAATALLEINDLVGAINAKEHRYTIIGAVDDNAALHGTEIDGIKILGGLSVAKTFKDAFFVFAISSFKIRLERINIFKNLGIARDRFVTLIHPTADISPTSKIGLGCTIYSNSFIAPRVVIGDFCIVYNSVVISPYSRLEDFAMTAGLSFIGGRVHLGMGAFTGGASAVAQNVKIGPGGMIGTASAVYRDVPPGIFMLGNPAKTVRGIPVSQELLDAWEEQKKAKA